MRSYLLITLYYILNCIITLIPIILVLICFGINPTFTCLFFVFHPWLDYMERRYDDFKANLSQ